jgi:hypothetical protein
MAAKEKQFQWRHHFGTIALDLKVARKKPEEI